MKATLNLKSTLFINLLFAVSFSVSAQIGIGTTTPQATLDITGQPTATTQLDGVIPPRLTGDQLRAKTYTATQTAAIVYVTAADSAPAGQTLNVTQAGYYYFNGTLWVRMAPESDDWKISGNSNTNASNNFVGTTNDVDLIFKRNNVQSGWLDNDNTAFGYNTLNPATTNTASPPGVFNTAVGESTLKNNTSGDRNTAIGSAAMELNTAGFWNSALGRYALHDNTSGSRNMAIGQEAAKFNTTGDSNVAIGFSALKNNTTGSYNIAIGRSAVSGGTVGVAYGDNNIAIGYNTQLPLNSASNQMVLGNDTTTRTIINGIVNAAAGAPANSNAAGVQGEIRVVGNFLYVYCSDNRWRRASLSTF